MMEPITSCAASAEDRRLAYRVAADYELAVGQMRFQLLSIYIAAVGVIIGFGSGAHFVGALLIGVTAGLFVIDLRNRDLLRRYRPVGLRLEPIEGGIFGGRGDRDEGGEHRQVPAVEHPRCVGVLERDLDAAV